MTSQQSTALNVPASAQPYAPAVPPAAGSAKWWARDGITFPATMALVLAILLPLQNRYWVPGGDSEAYLAAARSLALGHGFRFNAQPISMFPPGWPALLAMVLHWSTAFLTLKLLTMSCMVAALACAYWVCRRFCTPPVAAVAVLLSAITSYVFQLTIWLHSDALFVLLTALQVLAAMWVREASRPGAKLTRGDVWRACFLALLCAAAVTVRWAALINFVLIAAVLAGGLVRRTPEAGTVGAGIWTIRQWRQQRAAVFALSLALVVTLATFAAWRLALHVTPQEAAAAESTNAPDEEIKADANVSGSYQLIQKPQHGVLGYARRLGTWGDWLSNLFWQPLRLGQSMAPIELVSVLAGTALLLTLIVAAWDGIGRGEWLWTGLLVYTLALAINWEHANSRYLVPVIFLLLAGIFDGAAIIARRWPKWRFWLRAGIGAFVASLIICNGALWAVEVDVERSSDFYAHYEAGLNRDLIVAARYLSEKGAGDVQIGVSERYVNLGRIRISRYPLRALAMLTGKAIVSVPARYCDPAPADGSAPILLNWVRQAKGAPIKWYLFEPDVSPWRVWHFRLGWLQQMHEGAPPVDTGAGWRLYRMPEYAPTSQPTTHPSTLIGHPLRAPTTRAVNDGSVLPPSINGLKRPLLIDLRKLRPDLYRDPWPTHVPGM